LFRSEQEKNTHLTQENDVTFYIYSLLQIANAFQRVSKMVDVMQTLLIQALLQIRNGQQNGSLDHIQADELREIIG